VTVPLFGTEARADSFVLNSKPKQPEPDIRRTATDWVADQTASHFISQYYNAEDQGRGYTLKTRKAIDAEMENRVRLYLGKPSTVKWDEDKAVLRTFIKNGCPGLSKEFIDAIWGEFPSVIEKLKLQANRKKG